MPIEGLYESDEENVPGQYTSTPLSERVRHPVTKLPVNTKPVKYTSSPTKNQRKSLVPVQHRQSPRKTSIQRLVGHSKASNKKTSKAQDRMLPSSGYVTDKSNYAAKKRKINKMVQRKKLLSKQKPSEAIVQSDNSEEMSMDNEESSNVAAQVLRRTPTKGQSRNVAESFQRIHDPPSKTKTQGSSNVAAQVLRRTPTKGQSRNVAESFQRIHDRSSKTKTQDLPLIPSSRNSPRKSQKIGHSHEQHPRNISTSEVESSEDEESPQALLSRDTGKLKKVMQKLPKNPQDSKFVRQLASHPQPSTSKNAYASEDYTSDEQEPHPSHFVSSKSKSSKNLGQKTKIHSKFTSSQKLSSTGHVYQNPGSSNRSLINTNDPSWIGNFKQVAKTQPRRRQDGVQREINMLRRTTNLLIRKAPFHRLVREICCMYAGEPYRFQALAIEALQEAAESYLIKLYENSNLATLHAKRKTLMNKDIQFVRRLLEDF